MNKQTATMSMQVIVRVSPAKTFNALTDWSHQSEWMLGTSVEATHLAGQAVGGRIRAFTGVGRLGFWDTMTIVEWDPPRRCKVKHTGSIVRGSGSFDIAEHGNGTACFNWTEELELPFGLIGRIGWVLVRPFAMFGVRLSLRRFARWAERV